MPHEQRKNKKLTVHEMIKERLHARRKQLVQEVVSEVVQSNSQNVQVQTILIR